MTTRRKPQQPADPTGKPVEYRNGKPVISRPKPKRKTITDTDRINWLENANQALIRAECKNEWAVWVDSIKCFAISSTIRGTIDKAMKADAKPKGGRS